MELKAKVSSTKTTIDFLIIEIDVLFFIFCYLLLTNIYWLGIIDYYFIRQYTEVALRIK